MRSTLDLMSALGGLGGANGPITRPPIMQRPYPPGILPPRPDQSGAHPPPLQDTGEPPQMAPNAFPPSPIPFGGGMDAGPPMELPGGMKPPAMPAGGPDVGAPEEESGLGRRFLAALGKTVRSSNIGETSQPYKFRRE